MVVEKESVAMLMMFKVPELNPQTVDAGIDTDAYENSHTLDRCLTSENILLTGYEKL